jgi:hypothetical protein
MTFLSLLPRGVMAINKNQLEEINRFFGPTGLFPAVKIGEQGCHAKSSSREEGYRDRRCLNGSGIQRGGGRGAWLVKRIAAVFDEAEPPRRRQRYYPGGGIGDRIGR